MATPTTTTHWIDSEETVDRSGDQTSHNEFKPKGYGTSEHGVSNEYFGPMNVVGGQLHDTFVGGLGNDYFKDSGGGSHARGGSGRDYLEGGNGVNILHGGYDSDILVGNQHDATADRLYGGSHDDYLVAGRMKDSNREDDGTGALTDSTRGNGPTDDAGSVLRGGSGVDHFVLNPDSYVYIADYERMREGSGNHDRIYVTGLGDEKPTVVHHPDGVYGLVHFRIMLGDKVLAEINYRAEGGDFFSLKSPEGVARAKEAIRDTIVEVRGEWVLGTHEDDRLEGTESHDTIIGNIGDDVIDGGDGVDTLYGGHGNDVIRGGAGHDNLYGHRGNDTLHGGADRDAVYGGGGNDLLYGGDGGDQLYGGAGHDRLDGGAGRDVLWGDDGRDIFVVGHEEETAASGWAADIIADFNVEEDYIRLPMGVAWDDVRFIRAETDPQGVTTHLVTGTGESQQVLARLSGFEDLDAEQLQALKGKVEFIWDFDPNEVLPDPDAGKTIEGTNKKDLLVGGNNNDTIEGLGAMDVLYGRGGDDKLYGGSGKDTLYGGSGDDFLFGDGNNDILHGGAGGDTLHGGNSDDRLYGEDGDDTLNGDNGDDKLYGGAGSDKLDGGDGNDRLEGGEGELDVLAGGAGKDRLFGDGGNDRLEGGEGADRLHGGEGADEFLFRAGDGVDVITDFSVEDNDTLIFLAQTEAQAMAGNGEKFLQVSDLKVVDDYDAGGVRITSNKLDNEIILKGVTFEQLSADNFAVVTMEEYNDLL